MIEVSIRELVNSVDSLKELVTKPMKVKTAYHIARLAREVEKETSLFEEKRNILVQKYAERDENGKLIINENNQCAVAKDNTEKFIKEISELLDSKVEINVEKIKLEDLDCDINPMQVMAMMVFIEE